MPPRLRFLGYVTAGALMVLGVVTDAILSGSTGETVGILLVAIGGLQLITLLLLEKRPDQRAAEKQQRAQERRHAQIAREEEARHRERTRHEHGHEPSTRRTPARRAPRTPRRPRRPE
jgi:ABC-type nickel/cobalt efflux system permease component RcnA